jgi:hypothetical protein
MILDEFVEITVNNRYLVYYEKLGYNLVGYDKIKIKTTDLQMCNVIMDYASKKIEKCIIEGKKVDADWDRMNDYYKNIYPALVDQLEKNNTVNT